MDAVTAIAAMRPLINAFGYLMEVTVHGAGNERYQANPTGNNYTVEMEAHLAGGLIIITEPYDLGPWMRVQYTTNFAPLQIRMFVNRPTENRRITLMTQTIDGPSIAELRAAVDQLVTRLIVLSLSREARDTNANTPLARLAQATYGGIRNTADDHPVGVTAPQAAQEPYRYNIPDDPNAARTVRTPYDPPAEGEEDINLPTNNPPAEGYQVFGVNNLLNENPIE